MGGRTANLAPEVAPARFAKRGTGRPAPPPTSNTPTAVTTSAKKTRARRPQSAMATVSKNQRSRNANENERDEIGPITTQDIYHAYEDQLSSAIAPSSTPVPGEEQPLVEEDLQKMRQVLSVLDPEGEIGDDIMDDADIARKIQSLLDSVEKKKLSRGVHDAQFGQTMKEPLKVAQEEEEAEDENAVISTPSKVDVEIPAAFSTEKQRLKAEQELAARKVRIQQKKEEMRTIRHEMHQAQKYPRDIGQDSEPFHTQRGPYPYVKEVMMLGQEHLLTSLEEQLYESTSTQNGRGTSVRKEQARLQRIAQEGEEGEETSATQHGSTWYASSYHRPSHSDAWDNESIPSIHDETEGGEDPIFYPGSDSPDRREQALLHYFEHFLHQLQADAAEKEAKWRSAAGKRPHTAYPLEAPKHLQRPPGSFLPVEHLKKENAFYPLAPPAREPQEFAREMALLRERSMGHALSEKQRDKLLMDSYESFLGELRRKEAALVAAQRRKEIEDLRGPQPYWYEMKKRGFTKEMSKNNVQVLTPQKYQENIRRVKQLERAGFNI